MRSHGRHPAATVLVHEHLAFAPRDAPGSRGPNPWVPIGPSTVLHGQASDHPRVTGRVRDVAISSDGQRAYPDAASINQASTELTCGCLLVTFGAAADGSGNDA